MWNPSSSPPSSTGVTARASVASSIWSKRSRRRAALALDLLEEFRPLADRLALTLVNRGQLTAKDFCEREGGAFLLESDARKAVVVAYQERKQEELTHPLLAQPLALGLVPLVQARLLARAVRGETAGYLPFTIK